MGRDDAEGYAVEHRKFGKLVDQLKELTAAQAEKVVAALHRRMCAAPQRGHLRASETRCSMI